MSDLPPELVEEILTRVPALSLTRLRSTCKGWNVLFKDQRFTLKHFDKAAKQFLAYMWHENKFTSLTVHVHDNNIVAPFIEFNGKLGFTEDIIHDTKKTNLAGRNYKVMRYPNVMFRSGIDQDRVEIEIYEFSYGTWRVLEVTANFVIRPDHGVSLKGNTYWLAYDYNCLICFDFSAERFVRLSLPFKVTSWCTAALSIVSEEKFSVLHQNHETLKIEAWVATSDKTDETIVLSWKRFLAVDIFRWSGNLHFSSFLSFFIDEEKKLVVCCDDSICRYSHYNKKIKNIVFVIGEYGVYKEIHFGDRHAVIFDYTPSLVQIQESTVMLRSGKRKER